MPTLGDSADLVIIGGGGSGLAAAVRAREIGIRDVVVLEKTVTRDEVNATIKKAAEGMKRERVEVKLLDGALSFLDVDLEDFLALHRGRQVEEEDFIETASAKELRRKMGDVSKPAVF